MNIVEISKATESDESPIALQNAVISGSCNQPKVKPYRMIKNEITMDYDNKVLLRGTRSILPASRQKRAIQTVHEGHQSQVVSRQG